MVLTPAITSKITSFITSEISKAWAEKGHNLSGTLISELEYKIEANIIDVLMLDYGIIQDVGVKAANIPFSGSTGGGGTSKYIQGLMSYVALRMGISEGTKENKAIAFAIAHTQKKKGMRIQDNGQGSKWLTSVIPQIENGIMDILATEYAMVIEAQVLKSFK